MELGKIAVDVMISDKSLKTIQEQMSGLSTGVGKVNSLKISIPVDHTSLTELNKHLDKKIAHIRELNKTVISPKWALKQDVAKDFAEIKRRIENTALNLSVNTDKLEDQVRETLEKATTRISLKNTIKITELLDKRVYPKEFARQFKRIGDELIESFEDTGEKMSKSLIKGIQKQKSSINLEFKSIFSVPIRQFVSGAFFGFGQNAVVGISKGIAQAISASGGGLFGSAELLGEKLTESLISGLTDGLSAKLKQELGSTIFSSVKETFEENVSKPFKEKIQNLLGTENIAIAKYNKTATRDKEEYTKIQGAREGLVEDKRSVLRNRQDVRSRIEFNNSELQGLAVEEEKYTKIRDLAKERQSELPIDDIKGFKDLDTVYKEANDVLASINERTAALIEQNSELEKSYANLGKKLTNLKNLQTSIMPQEQNLTLMKALYTLNGNKMLDELKIPEVVPHNFKDKTTRAEYLAESNIVRLSPETFQRYQQNQMTKEDYMSFYHELEHGFDLDFGSVQGIQGRKHNIGLRKKRLEASNPSEAEYMTRFLSVYDPSLHFLEKQAELAGMKYGGQAFNEQYQPVITQHLQKQLGLSGSGLVAKTNQEVDTAKNALFELAATAKKMNVPLDKTSLGDVIKSFAALKESSQKIAQQMKSLEMGEFEADSPELTGIAESVAKQYEDIANIATRLKIVKLEILSQGKAILEQKKEQEAIRVATIQDMVRGFSDSYKAIKSDVKKGNLFTDYSSDDAEPGAFERATVTLENMDSVRKEIETIRSNGGIERIGTEAASKINQALGTVTKIEKGIRRLFTKEGIPLPEINDFAQEIATTLTNDVNAALDASSTEIKIPDPQLEYAPLPEEAQPRKSVFGDADEESLQRKKTPDEIKNQKIFNDMQNIIEDLEFRLKSFEKLWQTINKDTALREELVTEGLQKIADTTGTAEEKIKNFGTSAKTGFGNLASSLGKVVIGLLTITALLPRMKEFITSSVQVATEMENIKRQVVYAAPNVNSGQSAYEELAQNADELSLDRRSVLRAGGQFLAGSQGTNLEGQQAIDILKNFNQLQAARGLDKQQQDSFNLAIAQIVGKGGLQAQELKLQAGQALPGFVQIYARSQGLTPEQLNKKLQTTPGGLSTDTLLTASQQAKAESAIGIEEALKSNQAALTRFDNSLLKLQERVGNLFLPLQKSGLNLVSGQIDLLVEHFNDLLVQVGYVALLLAKPFLEPVRVGLQNLAKSFLDSASSGKLFANVLGFAKTTLVEMGTLLVVTKLVEGLVYAFSDASNGIKDFADASEKSLEKLNKTINSTSEEVKKLSKAFGSGFGEEQNKNLSVPEALKANVKKVFKEEMDKFLPGNSASQEPAKRIEAFKIAYDTASGLSKLNTTSTGILDTTNSDRFNNNLANTQRIDKQLEIIQAQKRAFVIDSPEDSQGLKVIQEREKALIDERYRNVAGVSQAQYIIETQIKTLKEAKKQLEDNDTYGQYTEDIQKAADNIEKLTKKQTELTKAIGQTATAFDRWKLSVQELTIVRDNDRIKLEKYVNASKTEVNNLDLKNALTQGQKGLQLSSIDINDLENQLKIQRDFVNLQKESFSSNSTVRATLNAQGINENTPIGKLQQKIELSSNENDKFILQQFENYQQSKIDLSNLQIQVSEAKANLLQNLRAQTKSVVDFYTQATRQAQSAQLEINKAIADINNELKYKSLAAKIRETMTGLEDGFFTQFVENIASQLEQVGQIKSQVIDQRVNQLNSQFKQEDLIKQAVELSRTLPGEAIKIPIDVDLSSPEALQQITSGLNKNFESTKQLTEIIDSNLKKVEDKLESNTKLSGEFSTKLLDIKETTNGIARAFEAVKDNISTAIHSGFNLYQMFVEAGKAAGNITQGLATAATVAANPVETVEAVSQVAKQATSLLGGVGKIEPFKIIDSNKLFNVTSYEQLTRHHANRGNERPHLYKIVEGKQEETNGGDLVKKDFVLVGKGGRQDVGVPSPLSGYVRTSSNYGTVEIYKDPAFKELMGRILHLSDFAVKTGDQINRGQVLGTQGGRGAGGRQGAYGVHFHGEFTPDVWKAYVKSLVTGDFGSITNAFKGTGLDKAWNNLLGTKPTETGTSSKDIPNQKTVTSYKDDAGLTAKGKEYAGMLNDPRVTAFLKAIATAEVGSKLVSQGRGYGKFIGGDYSREEIADPSTLTSIPGGRYRAFGRYQINNIDVDFAKKELGIQNLSPRNQDIIGVQRIAMRGALKALLAGDVDRAMLLAGKEFASLEGSPHNGDRWGNKTTAGGSKSAFMRNYQEALRGNNLVTSYKISDQVTTRNQPQQQQAVEFESPFIREYRKQLGNQVTGASLRGEYLNPSTMQSVVAEGLKAGLSAETGLRQATTQKSSIEIGIAQQKIAQDALRILNQQRETRRQEGEKNKDTVLDTLNRQFQAKGTPTIGETNANKLEGIIREFDRVLAQRQRDLKLTNDNITLGERLLKTPGVSEAQRAETIKGLETLRESKGVAEESIKILTEAKSTAISENARLFKNQATQRDFVQQNELYQQTITSLQSKLSALKVLQSLKPLDESVQQIPDLEKAISLRQLTVDTNKQINDIQQKVFSKEIEDPQVAQEMIANAKELSQLKARDIELTYQQAKANQLSTNIALNLQRQQLFLDAQSAKNKERSTLIQFSSRNTATSRDLSAQMKLEEENYTAKLNYDKLKENLRQQSVQGLITDGEYKGLRITGAIQNNLRTKNAKQDYDQSLLDTKQKYTQYLGQSESDVLNARANAENRRMGGNVFVANKYQREAATLQENIRYAKELQGIEQDIANQKALGIDVSGLEAVKNNMQEIHNLNLEGINAQFKTFGETINSVAADSLKSLSQGLTDVILKGGSIGDVFQNMAQTILSSIINSGISNLLGSIVGGGKPAKSGGLIMNLLGGGEESSSPFGFIGSLFGGILGFAGGGDISYMDMGNLRKGNNPIANALRKEGGNSVLAALTPGERILTVEENRKFKKLLGSNYQVLNFKAGGDVGALNLASDNVSKYAKSGNSSINIDASIEESDKSPDERALAKSIRTVVIAELARQKEIRNR